MPQITPMTVRQLVLAATESRRAEAEAEGLPLVTVPRFQRPIVWKKQQRDKLIESIRTDFPIGSLLLHANAGDTTVLLVDGLQRVSTLLNFDEDPLLYMDADSLVLPLREELARSLDGPADFAGLDAMDQAIGRWFAEMKTPQREDFDANSLLDYLQQAGITGINGRWPTDALNAARLICRAAREWAQPIYDYEVPVVVFAGPDEDLEEVFERLNSQGTMLSKYDRLAARWNSAPTRVAGPQIRQAIEAKYDAIEAAGLEVKELEPNPVTGEVDYNLYEYLLGLSTVLASDFPHLFPRTEHAEDGFLIATLSHGLRLSQAEMFTLPAVFARDETDIIDPANFEAALRGAATFVSEALSFLRVKLVRRGDILPADIAHKKLQMASLVADVMLTLYSPDEEWAPREGWGNEELRQLKRRLLSHYLVDLIRDEAWSGAGDSEAFRRLWNMGNDNQKDRRNYLEIELSAEEVAEALESWQARGLRSKIRRRPPSSALDRVMLRFIYQREITAAEQVGDDSFDVDHVIPVARLVAAVEAAGGEGWPIGAIGNLMLFPSGKNRGRRDRTLPEWVGAAETELDANGRRAEAERWLLDATAFDLTGIAQHEGKDRLTEGDFSALLAHRWRTIRGKIMAGLNLAD